MSRRLDLPIAAIAWLAGFAWLGWRGSWGPTGVLAAICAARLLVADPATRRLLVPTSRAIALAALAAVAMIAATYAAYAVAARVFAGLLPATGTLYVVLHAGGYGRAALAAIIVAIAACEEIVWRGRLLGPDARPASRGAGAPRVVAVAILYGACHLTSGSLLLAFVAAACGACWGFLRVAGRSLWTSIVVHVGWDLAVLVLWPLAGAGPGR